MKDIKQLVLENFNVIYYDTDQLNFKCSVKLKLDVNEMTLKFKYKDLKMFSDKNQSFANTKNETCIVADDGDNICLVTLNDISSIKCSKDGLMLADMLENISQEIDKAIKMCLWADDRHKNEGYNRLTELIEQKKQILIALRIDYTSIA
jgi:hypothetical protein